MAGRSATTTGLRSSREAGWPGPTTRSFRPGLGSMTTWSTSRVHCSPSCRCHESTPHVGHRRMPRRMHVRPKPRSPARRRAIGRADNDDGGVFLCNDVESPVPEPVTACDEEQQRRCREWGQGRTRHGYARATCRHGSLWACDDGDSHCRPLDPGVWPPPNCTCGDDGCTEAEVCISDTPGGPPYCAPSCSQPGG